MRFIVIAAMLAAGSVVAQDSLFLKDDVLAAEVAKNCSEGCVVLSPREAQMMMDAINLKLQERELAAFAAGVEAGKSSERAYGRCRT